MHIGSPTIKSRPPCTGLCLRAVFWLAPTSILPSHTCVHTYTLPCSGERERKRESLYQDDERYHGCVHGCARRTPRGRPAGARRKLCATAYYAVSRSGARVRLPRVLCDVGPVASVIAVVKTECGGGANSGPPGPRPLLMRSLAALVAGLAVCSCGSPGVDTTNTPHDVHVSLRLQRLAFGSCRYCDSLRV